MPYVLNANMPRNMVFKLCFHLHKPSYSQQRQRSMHAIPKADDSVIAYNQRSATRGNCPLGKKVADMQYHEFFQVRYANVTCCDQNFNLSAWIFYPLDH